MYIYMIRKLDTERYYCGGSHWCSRSAGIIWWDDSIVRKIFERLCEHWVCELVKFKIEEME